MKENTDLADSRFRPPLFVPFIFYLLSFLLASTPAWAQKRRPWKDQRLEWVGSMAKAKEIAARQKEREYILLYVHPPGDAKIPPAFQAEEVLRVAKSFVFVKIAFSKEDPTVQAYKITRIPTVMGLDRYGNEFPPRFGRAGPGELRRIVREVPARVKQYLEDLRRDLEEARRLVKMGRQDKALKKVLPRVQDGKVGYPELERAMTWIVEYGRKLLAAIEAETDPAAALKKLEHVAGKFKGTPIALVARIHHARIEYKEGRIREAIEGLRKVSTDTRFPAAAKEGAWELERIQEFGLRKVKAVLLLRSVGEGDEAREALKKIQEDYAGTPVAAAAERALK